MIKTGADCAAGRVPRDKKIYLRGSFFAFRGSFSARFIAQFGAYSRQKEYFGSVGSIWVYSGIFGYIWAYLGLFGPIWAYLGLFGSIWADFPRISVMSDVHERGEARGE